MCLIQYINNIENLEQILCPFNNQNDLECKNVINENELKILLDKNSYEKYLSSKKPDLLFLNDDSDENFKVKFLDKFVKYRIKKIFRIF